MEHIYQQRVNTPHKVWGCSKDPLHQELQALSEVGADCQKFSSSWLHFGFYRGSSPSGHGSHHCTLAVELEGGEREGEEERERKQLSHMSTMKV